MDNTIETIEYKGYEIELWQDYDYPFDPRIDCDNLGTMTCFHRNYSLGDNHDFKGIEDFPRFQAG